MGVREPDQAAYERSMLDWAACAVAGLRHGASDELTTPVGLEDEILTLGIAGHILDFDDTFTPGLSHISAPTAPVALRWGAELGVDLAEVVRAYAVGFEAMAVFSEASHPALYDRGWHPTSVCGAVGSAVTAAELMGLSGARTADAVRLALLSAAGLLVAFGSHGKPYQVGLAALHGLVAARSASRGLGTSARVERGRGSFADLYGGVLPEDLLARATTRAAIRENWIKAYPACLQTHAGIDAGLAHRAAGEPVEGLRATVWVHPISLQAAGQPADVDDGLQAKFSIPYTVALALLRGAPTRASFEAVDPAIRSLAQGIVVETDQDLDPNACIMEWSADGGQSGRIVIDHPRGSAGAPLSDQGLDDKIVALGAVSLGPLFAEPGVRAGRIVEHMFELAWSNDRTSEAPGLMARASR